MLNRLLFLKLLSETTRMGHPAMRIIVAESNNSKIKVGTLFLITCSGGTIGREGNHAIVLPDINISKVILILSYAFSFLLSLLGIILILFSIDLQNFV